MSKNMQSYGFFLYAWMLFLVENMIHLPWPCLWQNPKGQLGLHFVVEAQLQYDIVALDPHVYYFVSSFKYSLSPLSLQSQVEARPCGRLYTFVILRTTQHCIWVYDLYGTSVSFLFPFKYSKFTEPLAPELRCSHSRSGFLYICKLFCLFFQIHFKLTEPPVLSGGAVAVVAIPFWEWQCALGIFSPKVVKVN